MIKILILSITIALFATSCKDNAKMHDRASQSENRASQSEKKVEKKIKKLDSKLIKEEFYEVSFNLKNEISSTEELLFSVKAIPRKNRHINDAFPSSITIESDCFKFDKKKYKSKDAKKLDEKSLEFELKSKCENKGKHELKGKFKFGYCTDEMCYTYDSPFKFNIDVK